MTFASLKKGIAILYGGKENPYLAELIYFYFSRGLMNSEVSYYKFITTLITDLMTDKNRLVFRLLDENLDNTLQMIEIVRFYVNIPANAKFSFELRKLFKHYI
jgi:hypothetical protein